MAFFDEIKNKNPKMFRMLRSVYSFNSEFSLSKEQELLLEKIIKAMSIIDRKYFFHGDFPYEDMAMPIEHEQTISQPSTVARMLLLAELGEGDSVLEVGTGSGWNAALISFLVYPGKVTSIERISELSKTARENLTTFANSDKKHKYFGKNVEFRFGNIFDFKTKEKYNKIIITAGIREGEENRLEKIVRLLLKRGGILLCPYQKGPLIVYKKEEGLKKYLTKEKYVFVPLLDS